jgi:hypothetical protein
VVFKFANDDVVAFKVAGNGYLTDLNTSSLDYTSKGHYP